jgi:enoyl-CoA hydratase/carnithine racemase
VLVLMDGFTLGGGMGLAQGCDLRVVTERSRLGMPEVGIGYFPDVGGSYFLPRMPGELGIYLGVSGTQIQAADALYCGLADWYLDSDKLAALDEGSTAWHSATTRSRTCKACWRGSAPRPGRCAAGQAAPGDRPLLRPARPAQHHRATARGEHRRQP